MAEQRFIVTNFTVESPRSYTGTINDWPEGIYTRMIRNDDDVPCYSYVIRHAIYGNYQRSPATENQWMPLSKESISHGGWTKVQGTVTFNEVKTGRLVSFYED